MTNGAIATPREVLTRLAIDFMRSTFPSYWDCYYSSIRIAQSGWPWDKEMMDFDSMCMYEAYL